MMGAQDAIDAMHDVLAPMKAVDAKSVWHEGDGGTRFIVTAHGMMAGDGPIIHTKMMLWTDPDRTEIASNSFTYLYDVGCMYRTVRFVGIDGLRKAMKWVLDRRLFSKELKTVSDMLLLEPERRIRESVRFELPIDRFEYRPEITVRPCESTTYDFIVSISDNTARVSIARADGGWTVSARRGEDDHRERCDTPGLYQAVAYCIKNVYEI